MVRRESSGLLNQESEASFFGNVVVVTGVMGVESRVDGPCDKSLGVGE